MKTQTKSSKSAAAKAIAKRTFADLSKAAKKAWATRRAMAKSDGKLRVAKSNGNKRTPRPTTPTPAEQPRAA